MSSGPGGCGTVQIMGNPARELHSIYSDWRRKATSDSGKGRSSHFTTIAKPETDAGFAKVRRAAACLIELERLLAALELRGMKVKTFRRQIRDWWDGVLLPGHHWDSGLPADSLMSSDHMDEIEVCADYLDLHTREFDIEDLAGVRDILERAKRLVLEDEGLSDDLRIYIVTLIQRITIALDQTALGLDLDLAHLVRELHVAFQAAEQEDTAKRGTWHTLWTQTIAGLFVESAGQVGAAYVKAISS